MRDEYGNLRDWFLCFGLGLLLAIDMAARRPIATLQTLVASLSPLRRVFGVLSLLAISYSIAAAFGEQAASPMNPRGAILWFTGAAVNTILLFWICEELVTTSRLYRRLFLVVVGVLLMAAFRHQVNWVMAAADEAARSAEIREAQECLRTVNDSRRDDLQRKLYKFMVSANGPSSASPGRKSGKDVGGASLSSPDEPAERATLRVMAIKANISGGINFEATVVVQNVGKYIALPWSFVRSAVKESPLLPGPDDGILFKGAPDFSGKTVSSPEWHRGGDIAEKDPLYPGDIRSLTVQDFVPAVSAEAADYATGARGWYVLTRALFHDKLGKLPYRDSCTFFSVKAPNGAKCWTHND